MLKNTSSKTKIAIIVIIILIIATIIFFVVRNKKKKKKEAEDKNNESEKKSENSSNKPETKPVNKGVKDPKPASTPNVDTKSEMKIVKTDPLKKTSPTAPVTNTPPAAIVKPISETPPEAPGILIKEEMPKQDPNLSDIANYKPETVKPVDQ